jgi:hypothetical protein
VATRPESLHPLQVTPEQSEQVAFRSSRGHSCASPRKLQKLFDKNYNFMLVLYRNVEVKHQDENFNTPLPPTAGKPYPAFFFPKYGTVFTVTLLNRLLWSLRNR